MENIQNVILISRAGEPVSEPEPGVGGSLEPEPLEKKPGAGAAWKKSRETEPEPLKSSSVLLEDKKHKEIVLLVLFFR